MSDDFALSIARSLNGIVSKVIESMAVIDLAASRDVAFAELGTELQGTWANKVGAGAAKEVELILEKYIVEKKLGSRESARAFALKSGWRVIFGSEPDIRFVDAGGKERIVIEIKGSLDRAGAQTRYGEAKKTFAKALARNPRCFTVYLASCFTEAVARQIEADGQVRQVSNLTSIIYGAKDRKLFLEQIFHQVNAPS